ncbi:hypothetical protein FNL37_1923 [Methylovorus glucosotrophus]|uniref:YdbL family protein n=1 Tax=Methylovorus glucosotrophus TaxID=266009 RepID=UPI0013314C70|nr:YdbL family protein [Methylovorus glucosotrophus]KAF0844473.1 hypothetical protein FNL37_1923 [Methylovorus glucosotrophus]
MKNIIIVFSLMMSMWLSLSPAHAAADLEINTPAISAIKNSMQARHAQLAPFYSSGAVGFSRDGLVAVRDAAAVPLAQRQALNSLVAAENKDRNALYAEIANGNQHPEWEPEIRATFAKRWADKAQGGWWVQDGSGWIKK